MMRLLTVIKATAIVILAFLAIAMIGPVLMRMAMQPYMYLSADSAPQSQVAIVLGASVFAGKPSPILAERADAAIALYQSGKVSKILVTGDSRALSHDEVTPVKKYLLDAGVQPEDIFLDRAGLDTYSSMYRAVAIYGVRSAIIVTQDFHLPRSLFIARNLGIDAYGLVVDGTATSPFDYVREIPAAMKAYVDILIRRVPAVLGPAVPISGDGRSTWY